LLAELLTDLVSKERRVQIRRPASAFVLAQRRNVLKAAGDPLAIFIMGISIHHLVLASSLIPNVLVVWHIFISRQMENHDMGELSAL
jgi:hypothetical protein